MSNTQAPTGSCTECHRIVRYVQRDPHAFDWCCARCGACGVLCWDEDEPAPDFDAAPAQSTLFDDARTA